MQLVFRRLAPLLATENRASRDRQIRVGPQPSTYEFRIDLGKLRVSVPTHTEWNLTSVGLWRGLEIKE